MAILGRVDGRITIEYLKASSKSFTFKCHRTNQKGPGSLCYAVSSSSYCPMTKALITGGVDGTVVSWDVEKKSRISIFPLQDDGRETPV
jgi:hypothetical protein